MSVTKEFPTSAYLPPAEAVAEAAKLDWDSILFIGYDANGVLLVRSSRMSRSDALWLIEHAKKWALGDLT